MAGVYLNYTIYCPDDLIATTRTRINRTPKGMAMTAIAREFRRANTGHRRADVHGFLSSVRASKAVTCTASAAVADTDTLVIAGTTLAAKASPANESQFAIGATDAAYAATLVSTINAHSVLSKIVYAVVTTSASGIFTIYAIVPGPIGNLVTLSEAGDGFAIAGGATALSGGTSDAVKHYQLGYSLSSHSAG